MNWSIDLVLKATLVLLAGLAVANERSRVSAALRDAVWTETFAGLLILPALVLLAPGWKGPVAISYTVEALARETLPGAARLDWIWWLWAAGAVVCLAGLLAAHLRAAWLTGRSRKLSPVGGVEIRETPAGTMPMTWGFLRPVLFLPSDASAWSADVRHSVVRHELAHIGRWDVWKQLLAQIACCFWWFHPLVWVAARRADRAREQACDNEVLRRGTTATAYADHLIQVARSRVTLAAAAGLPFGSQLESRILAVLDGRIRRDAMKQSTIWIACLLTVVALLPLAGMRLWAEEVYKAGDEGVLPPKLIEKVEPKYSEAASEAKIQGTVVLYVEISSEGVAENLEVTEGLEPSLDENAMAAVQQWRFEPGTKNGTPVRMAATIEINYRLE